MSLLRKKPSDVELSDEDKQAQLAESQRKAVRRNARMAQTKEARKAVAAMTPPEPMRGIYAGIVLVGIAIFSLLSKDVAEQSKTVKGKTVQYLYHYPAHPPGAILLGVLALVAMGSIYFRRRLVTVLTFMVTGAVGVDAPLPKADTDLRWVAFLVPAGYALWVYAFRMRKEQTAWVTAHPLPGDTVGRASASRASASRAASSRAAGSSRAAQKTGTSASSGRRRKGKETPLVGANGRALPIDNGRYTRPKAKPRPASGRAAPPARSGQPTPD